MIIIKEANSKALLKEYVKFPFSLYKKHSYWVPPLIQEELDSFDKTKNPAFENAEANFYLAYKDKQIVGRIAAIINWDEVNNLEKKKVRFGWWDAIDNVEVTKALLEKVVELGKKNKLEYDYRQLFANITRRIGFGYLGGSKKRNRSNITNDGIYKI